MLVYSGQQKWECLTPGCRGRGVNAYLMPPVASISLGMDCEITTRLRHQRRPSLFQAGMEARLDKDYMEVSLLRELFSTYFLCAVE